MKKFALFMMMIVCALCLPACGDDDDTYEVDEEWKAENAKAFADITKNAEYREIVSEGYNGSVYVKELQKGDGTEPIYYTSTIKAYFKCTLIDGTTIYSYLMEDYDAAIIANQKYMIKALNSYGEVTYVSYTLLEGINVALQHMVQGDKWEIWIPQQLAFGNQQYTSSGVVIAKPYSTIICTLEVVDVEK